MAADHRQMRASDADRDRVAELLREHHAVGRLTAQEFSERLDQVFDATTIGDLDDLMADLPGIDLYRLPDASVRRSRPIQGGSSHLSALRASGGLPSIRIRSGAWGAWLSLSLLCFVIWALSGGGYLWPLWVAGPLGAILAGQALAGGRRGISHPGHGHPPNLGHGHGHGHGLSGEHGQLGGDPSEP